MKEQKRYQIEKVIHNRVFETVQNCCIVDYYKKKDLFLQINYSDENFAKSERTLETVGMWRIKQQNLKQSKN